MEFLDFCQLLEAAPASFVAMSTFDFQPDFFEHRLLRAAALVKARRIVVFMDAGQWAKLIRDEQHARFLNRRYLVVPVRGPKGVFHPKLHLLVRDDGAQVLCGSNNLTRPGCTSNLELLNSFTIGGDVEDPAAVRLACDAFVFFRKACEAAGNEPARVARAWLDDLAGQAPWLTTNAREDTRHPVELLHTYDGSIWDRIVAEVGDKPPKKFLIVSPFYDRDAALMQRLREAWPKCEVQIVAQHKTSNLPAKALKKCGPNVQLAVLQAPVRRLHAKLLAWETSRGTGCLVGSANFTTAALDGRNVETCLLIRDAGLSISELFGKDVRTKPTAFDEFEVGLEQEPSPEEEDEGSLWVESAVLSADQTLRVTYGHNLNPPPTSLRLRLKTFGERLARVALPMPKQAHGTHTIPLPNEAVQGCHVAMIALLVADVGEDERESSPAWVVQEDRLTHEASGEHKPSNTSIIQETGWGLVEMLDQIAEQDGIAAMIEYLRQLNVRFDAGGRQGRGLGSSLLRRRDPFRPDVVPVWKRQETADAENLKKAIYECIDRHEKKVLLRHARLGNINGMRNFVDVLKMIVRLLYIRHTEGLVPRGRVIGYLLDHVQIAVHGIEKGDEAGDGFLFSVYDNLEDSDTIQGACDEERFLVNVFAAFVILQRIRFDPNETSVYGKVATRPRECLQAQRNRLIEAVEEIGLELPTQEEVLDALRDYQMFSEEELAAFSKEMPIP
jgi:hypothetical protein